MAEDFDAGDDDGYDNDGDDDEFYITSDWLLHKILSTHS